jgi:hypothetical protein
MSVSYCLGREEIAYAEDVEIANAAKLKTVSVQL